MTPIVLVEQMKQLDTTYLNARDTTEYEMMLVKVSVHCQPSTNTLLFGNTVLDYNQNCDIFFLAVQKFIIESKRFKLWKLSLCLPVCLSLSRKFSFCWFVFFLLCHIFTFLFSLLYFVWYVV